MSLLPDGEIHTYEIRPTGLEEQPSGYFRADSCFLTVATSQTSKSTWLCLWSGAHVSGERKTAALQILENKATSLKGTTVQLCQTSAGNESSAYLSLFPVFLTWSGADANFFCVLGGPNDDSRISEIPAQGSALGPTLAFILFYDNAAHVWYGHQCPPARREFARRSVATVARILGKSASVIYDIQEGTEDTRFWKFLGGKVRYSNAGPQRPAAKETKVYEVHGTGNSATLVQVPPVLPFAYHGEVLIVNESDVLVWTPPGYSGALNLDSAQNFCQSRGASATMWRVTGGNEPGFFKALFAKPGSAGPSYGGLQPKGPTSLLQQKMLVKPFDSADYELQKQKAPTETEPKLPPNLAGLMLERKPKKSLLGKGKDGPEKVYFDSATYQLEKEGKRESPPITRKAKTSAESRPPGLATTMEVMEHFEHEKAEHDKNRHPHHPLSHSPTQHVTIVDTPTVIDDLAVEPLAEDGVVVVNDEDDFIIEDIDDMKVIDDLEVIDDLDEVIITDDINPPPKPTSPAPTVTHLHLGEAAQRQNELKKSLETNPAFPPHYPSFMPTGGKKRAGPLGRLTKKALFDSADYNMNRENATAAAQEPQPQPNETGRAPSPVPQPVRIPKHKKKADESVEQQYIPKPGEKAVPLVGPAARRLKGKRFDSATFELTKPKKAQDAPAPPALPQAQPAQPAEEEPVQVTRIRNKKPGDPASMPKPNPAGVAMRRQHKGFDSASHEINKAALAKDVRNAPKAPPPPSPDYLTRPVEPAPIPKPKTPPPQHSAEQEPEVVHIKGRKKSENKERASATGMFGRRQLKRFDSATYEMQKPVIDRNAPAAPPPPPAEQPNHPAPAPVVEPEPEVVHVPRPKKQDQPAALPRASGMGSFKRRQGHFDSATFELQKKILSPDAPPAPPPPTHLPTTLHNLQAPADAATPAEEVVVTRVRTKPRPDGPKPLPRGAGLARQGKRFDSATFELNKAKIDPNAPTPPPPPPTDESKLIAPQPQTIETTAIPKSGRRKDPARARLKKGLVHFDSAEYEVKKMKEKETGERSTSPLAPPALTPSHLSKPEAFRYNANEPKQREMTDASYDVSVIKLTKPKREVIWKSRAPTEKKANQRQSPPPTPVEPPNTATSPSSLPKPATAGAAERLKNRKGKRYDSADHPVGLHNRRPSSSSESESDSTEGELRHAEPEDKDQLIAHLRQQIKQLELTNSALERQLGLVRSEVRQFTSRLSELL